MRPGIAAALAMALVVPAPATAQEQPPYPWNQRTASAKKFARARAGRVDFAVVSPDGRVRGSGIHARHVSASVVKAMLLVAYLNHGNVPRRELNATEKSFLRPMIVRSDNKAATRTRNIVGNAGLSRLARRVWMKDFATSSRSWGSTRISPYDQTRFFFRLDSFIPPRHRAYARSLLSGIVGRQRWGIPPAVPAGWALYFKGGWLPPRLVNQVGLLERGNTRIAIAVMTDGDPSLAYGQKTIQGVAERLLERLNEFAP